jgi:ankyrin repeat protein
MEKVIKVLCKQWTNAHAPLRVILSVDEGGAHPIEVNATASSLGFVDGEKLFARLISREESVSGNASGFQHLKLLDAAESGCVADMQVLLAAAGANKDWGDDDGSTALACAAAVGQCHAAKILLEAGADKEKASKAGVTPLHAATERGHTRVVVMLLEAGADKDKTADNGLTPLCFAALGGLHERAERGLNIDLCKVANILMEFGADMNKADSDGNTPLYIAASVRPGNIYGNIPLHLANAEKFVSLLLDAGADKDKANNLGRTPLHVAAKRGHTHIVQVLLSSRFWGERLTLC